MLDTYSLVSFPHINAKCPIDEELGADLYGLVFTLFLDTLHFFLLLLFVGFLECSMFLTKLSAHSF